MKVISDVKLNVVIQKIKELLNGKANTNHTHSVSEVTNLQSTLDAKVPTSRTINGKALTANVTLSASDVGAATSSHNHAASNITSGTLSSDRLPTVPVAKGGTGATTAAAARTNLGITLDNIGAASAEHEHDIADITDLQTNLNNKQDKLNITVKNSGTITLWGHQEGNFMYVNPNGNTIDVKVKTGTSTAVTQETFASPLLCKIEYKSITTPYSRQTYTLYEAFVGKRVVNSLLVGSGYNNSTIHPIVNTNNINRLLPVVTTADNGKLLKVVNGVWTAVSIPNAEEASF